MDNDNDGRWMPEPCFTTSSPCEPSALGELKMHECEIDSADFDQMPHLQHLIWVYTVCSGLPVTIVITMEEWRRTQRLTISTSSKIYCVQ